MTVADREALAQRIAGAFAKLADHQTEVLQLWREFENLHDDERIMGCATKTEYCTKVLGRSMRAVQYMLAGGNPRETISCGGIQTTCETCGDEFPSKGKYRKHLKKAHPELLSTVPEMPTALLPQPTAPSLAGIQVKKAEFLKSIAPSTDQPTAAPAIEAEPEPTPKPEQIAEPEQAELEITEADAREMFATKKDVVFDKTSEGNPNFRYITFKRDGRFWRFNVSCTRGYKPDISGVSRIKRSSRAEDIIVCEEVFPVLVIEYRTRAELEESGETVAALAKIAKAA